MGFKAKIEEGDCGPLIRISIEILRVDNIGRMVGRGKRYSRCNKVEVLKKEINCVFNKNDQTG